MATGDPITVNFLFDVGSVYSWLALTVLLRYKRIWGLRLILRPVLLGAVLKDTGNEMPSRVPARGKWLGEDLKRNARFMQVPWKGGPSNFGDPSFNTLPCQRLLIAVAMDKGNESQELISIALSFYKAIWGTEHGQGVNLGDTSFLLQCCLDAGFSKDTATEYLKKAKETSVKEKLKNYTKIAGEKGVFGTPTLYVYLQPHNNPDWQWETQPHDYMIFGSDRFEQLAFVLGKKWDGPVPLSSSRL